MLRSRLGGAGREISPSPGLVAHAACSYSALCRAPGTARPGRDGPGAEIPRESQRSCGSDAWWVGAGARERNPSQQQTLGAQLTFTTRLYFPRKLR